MPLISFNEALDSDPHDTVMLMSESSADKIVPVTGNSISRCFERSSNPSVLFQRIFKYSFHDRARSKNSIAGKDTNSVEERRSKRVSCIHIIVY